jgi:hypothetical protein
MIGACLPARARHAAACRAEAGRTRAAEGNFFRVKKMLAFFIFVC